MNKTERIAELLMNPHYQLKQIVFTQKCQFEMWISKVFLLNDELHKEYNPFYNDIFNILIYQLLTEGCDHVEHRILPHITPKNVFMKRWGERLHEGLKTMREQYSDIEFAFLEYHRHSVCHIFQTGYDVIYKDGTIKSHEAQTKKIKKTSINKPIINIELDFFKLLEEYGGDSGFDTSFREKLYPIIKQLQADLSQIHEEEILNEYGDSENTKKLIADGVI